MTYENHNTSIWSLIAIMIKWNRLRCDFPIFLVSYWRYIEVVDQARTPNMDELKLIAIALSTQDTSYDWGKIIACLHLLGGIKEIDKYSHFVLLFTDCCVAISFNLIPIFNSLIHMLPLERKFTPVKLYQKIDIWQIFLLLIALYRLLCSYEFQLDSNI